MRRNFLNGTKLSRCFHKSWQLDDSRASPDFKSWWKMDSSTCWFRFLTGSAQTGFMVWITGNCGHFKSSALVYFGIQQIFTNHFSEQVENQIFWVQKLRTFPTETKKPEILSFLNSQSSSQHRTYSLRPSAIKKLVNYVTDCGAEKPRRPVCLPLACAGGRVWLCAALPEGPGQGA